MLLVVVDPQIVNSNTNQNLTPTGTQYYN